MKWSMSLMDLNRMKNTCFVILPSHYECKVFLKTSLVTYSYLWFSSSSSCTPLDPLELVPPWKLSLEDSLFLEKSHPMWTFRCLSGNSHLILYFPAFCKHFFYLWACCESSSYMISCDRYALILVSLLIHILLNSVSCLWYT